MSIHPTAIIDPDAELADDVEVQAYTIIGPQVRIGAGTVVGPHCTIDGRTVIGERNRFYSGAQIGIVPQDLKHNHDFLGRFEMGDGNVVREHVTMSSSTMQTKADEDKVTRVGSNCLFMAYSHVAHECNIGSQVIMANSVALAGHVEVEDEAIIGGLSAVHQFVRIGQYAMIGGMTRLSNDAPPYMITAGVPALVSGPNTVGLKRHGFSREQRARIKQMFKIIYRSGLNTTQAMTAIEAQVEESSERSTFIEFVRKSNRGITR
jgi:UDP-N-acetylglucosamine acyltransferase